MKYFFTFANRMNIQRFIISWILATVFMFAMSYTWHGIILSDFNNIPYDFSMFLVLSVIVYLCIGAGLTLVFSYIDFENRKLIKRFMIGGAVGFFLYLIAFTLGVSFQGNQIKHLAVDFFWQMLEQGTGAFVIHVVFSVFEIKSKMLKT